MPQQCASDILDGIGEFIFTNDPCSVDRIKLVIYEPYMLEDFKVIFRNKIGKSYGYRAKKGKVTINFCPKILMWLMLSD